MVTEKNTIILLPALGIAHQPQSRRLRTEVLDDAHFILHKVVHDLSRQRKILPQYVYAAIRINQTLSYHNDLFVFFAHFLTSHSLLKTVLLYIGLDIELRLTAAVTHITNLSEYLTIKPGPVMHPAD